MNFYVIFLLNASAKWTLAMKIVEGSRAFPANFEQFRMERLEIIRVPLVSMLKTETRLFGLFYLFISVSLSK